MTTLITLLISLLGYGSPADYTDYTEAQLITEIETVQNNQNTSAPEDDGGGWDIWDEAGHHDDGGTTLP